MWLDLSEWARNVKRLVFHANVHQKVTSVEKDFNNQRDRLICFVNTSQLLFPTPPHTPSTSELLNKVAGIESMHGLIKSWPQLPLSAQSANSRAQHNCQYDTVSQGGKPATGGRLLTLDCFYHGSDSIPFLLEQSFTLDVDLPSLHMMLLPKLPLMDLVNAFFTIIVFHTALLLTQ